ncbi:hypothetical protein [Dactylosporangium salmoneum]|uniref:Methionyl-tRNA formyltransferase-like protein n=1 Tax=Dactylosporangium salmoneum TaxID=53361 RepID=A0ABN3HDI3_9ACTN
MKLVDREQAAAEFLNLLDKAARRVDDPWFLLPVAAEDTKAPVRRYRERVYCYELYHQIRVLATGKGSVAADTQTYVLSGEIDKAGLNAVIDGGLHKPDLVWHVPGVSEHNAVVVEVKAADNLQAEPLRKDLRTLRAFLDAERGYAHAAFLVYGWATEEALRQRLLRAADQLGLPDDVRRRTHLLWHPRARGHIRDLGSLKH